MLARFYKEELDYLRHQGPEFVHAHPGLASALSTPGADPDVERLLEGFAFLTARIRQRIEDDFPEIIHTLTGVLWPQFLRPTPSMGVVEFSSQPGKLRGRRLVPAGTEIQSVRTATGVSCRFRTSWDFDLLPLTLDTARIETGADGTPGITLSFRFQKDVRYQEIFNGPETGLMRLFLRDGATAVALVEALSRRVACISVHTKGGDSRTFTLGPDSIQFPGLRPDFSILPAPQRSFATFGVLQDYFSFPERYQFIDIAGLERARDIGIGEEFDLVIRLTDWPEGVKRVDKSNFVLGCVPVVNLFEYDARPIRIGRERSEYPLVPDSGVPDEMETFSVLRVGGISAGSGEERTFTPLYSFDRNEDGDSNRVYFKTRGRTSINGKTTETWISLVDAGDAAAIPTVETVFARLLCSNGNLPTNLAPGDLRESTATTPAGVRFKDITRLLPPIPPPLDGKTSWKLISLVATSYLTIADRDNLRTLLRLMDFRSVHDRVANRRLTSRLDAIESVNVAADDRLVRGRPVRGRAIEVTIRDKQFGGVSEVHLFGSVLDVAFSMFASINSHTRLTILAKDSGEEFRWKARHGTQILQ